MLQVEKAGMANQFKPNYPPMQQLQAKIQGTLDALAQEVRNAVSNVHEQYQASLEREKTLAEELEKQKSFALGLNDSAVRYLILEREADTTANSTIADSTEKNEGHGPAGRCPRLQCVSSRQGRTSSIPLKSQYGKKPPPGCAPRFGGRPLASPFSLNISIQP